MTALSIAAETPAAPRGGFEGTVTWAAVDSGLWSGSSAGAFVGVVERAGRGRYRAVNGYGRLIAECDSLEEAKARLLHPASRGPRPAVQAARPRERG